MSTFDKSYFHAHYRSTEDKSPQNKLLAYRDVIRRWAPASYPEKKQSLLDVGCGYGKFLRFVKDDYQTVGIDPSEYAIRAAKKENKNTSFEVATLSVYQPYRKFDIITAFDVIEHTVHAKEALNKIKSLLRSGGLFVCVIPVYDTLFGKIGGLLDRDKTHQQKLSRQEWLKLIAERFTILEVQGAVRYSLPLINRYTHLMKPWLKNWGQAILIAAKL